MQLQIRHETRYEYEEPVSYSIQALKLTPRADPGQRVVSWRVLVARRAARAGRSVRQPDADRDARDSPPRAVASSSRASRRSTTTSPLMPPDTGRPVAARLPRADVAHAARAPPCANSRSGISGRHPAGPAALMDLVVGIRAAVAYQPGITDVTHTAAEALDLGVGVCQDQAHVLVACCRAAGVPARYVSGYFHAGETSARWRATRGPTSGSAPDQGWLSLDVTHAEQAGDAPLPPGRRSRLPRRRAGARRAARRRVRVDGGDGAGDGR